MQIIVDKVFENPQLALYFPERKELMKMPRQYIVNVTYSIVGNDFKKWVHAKIQERNHRMTAAKKSPIDMIPLVNQAFQESSYVTSKFLVFFNLLNISFDVDTPFL